MNAKLIIIFQIHTLLKTSFYFHIPVAPSWIRVKHGMTEEIAIQ